MSKELKKEVRNVLAICGIKGRHDITTKHVDGRIEVWLGGEYVCAWEMKKSVYFNEQEKRSENHVNESTLKHFKKAFAAFGFMRKVPG